MSKEKPVFKRFSITMPEELCDELNQMVEERGLSNRSMAIADLVKRELLNYKQQDKSRVMAGTITISYDENSGKTAEKLIAIRRQYIDEVISSFQVMLEADKNLEVWLVQGKVDTLYEILSAALNVSTTMLGQLTFADALLPPLRGQ